MTTLMFATSTFNGLFVPCSLFRDVLSTSSHASIHPNVSFLHLMILVAVVAFCGCPFFLIISARNFAHGVGGAQPRVS